jgi:hypothetical protein
MPITKNKIEQIAREFIYDLAGVSQRDADNTADKIAFSIYRIIQNGTKEANEQTECFKWLCQNSIYAIESNNVLSYEIRFQLPSGNAFYDIKAAMEKDQ